VGAYIQLPLGPYVTTLSTSLSFTSQLTAIDPPESMPREQYCHLASMCKLVTLINFNAPLLLGPDVVVNEHLAR